LTGVQAKTSKLSKTPGDLNCPKRFSKVNKKISALVAFILYLTDFHYAGISSLGAQSLR